MPKSGTAIQDSAMTHPSRSERISQEMGQETMQILDRFLNQLPTFIVRERSRVRIYLSGDLEVPAYDAHQIDPTL